MSIELNHALEVLERTPGVVRAMVGGLSEGWTGGGTEDNWRPFDIVGHLVHGEVTDWIPRARIILEHGEEKSFEPFDRLAQFELSKGRTLDELIEEFARLRSENIDTLKSWNLSEEQLRSKGMHPELGKVTLSQLLATWVVHDLTHIRQIAVSMAQKYKHDVGPWVEYLSILK
jgi:hypothetical protein